jgi:hypothetical protein
MGRSPAADMLQEKPLHPRRVADGRSNIGLGQTLHPQHARGEVASVAPSSRPTGISGA